MSKVTPISNRKDEHIRINLQEDVRSGLTTGLERYRFRHRAAPELNLEEVDLTQELFGRKLHAPILISSMTGGAKQAGQINRNLAQAAQAAGAAMGVGSLRAALEHPELEASFQVRAWAPDILLLANLGAVQLNYGFDVEDCRRVVEMISADALILHFNALQEALQPEGETRFAGLLSKIEQVCRQLPVPVIAKEVGWGFSAQDVHNLVQVGVAAIDVAGAGGASWSQVEMHRAQDERQARLAAAFRDWGIPTAEAIQIVRQTAPELIVFASGGLRSGMDIAKCLALGARLGGMATPFLKTAMDSTDQTIALLEDTRREIQVCMFACGARNLAQLNAEKLFWVNH